jgi:hypothetical protein
MFQSMADEIAALKSMLYCLRQEGKRRDTLVLQNKQLESARQSLRTANDKAMRSLQLKHQCVPGIVIDIQTSAVGMPVLGADQAHRLHPIRQ